MRLGRIDDETTANVGIAPRRRDQRGPQSGRRRLQAAGHAGKLAAQCAHMQQALETAAARHTIVLDGREVRARVETTIEQSYAAMSVPDAAPIVQLVRRAAAALGHDVASAPMGGGCDANVLNGRGFQVANLGTGMRDIHTVKEWLKTTDMVRTAKRSSQMLRLHRTSPRGSLPFGSGEAALTVNPGSLTPGRAPAQSAALRAPFTLPVTVIVPLERRIGAARPGGG